MIYMIGLFILSGLVGTLIALRLQVLEIQEGNKTSLTRRGRIVVSLLVGLAVGLFVFFICGLWWACDPTSGVCKYRWGY
jgi:mannose/fructose/N-acetylgalactosamine-specific phosphotransferase system component IID